jgi:plastocyanin
LSAHPRARVVLCAVAITLAFVATACGSSSSPKSSSPSTTIATPTTAANTITIKNFMFGDPISVKAGSTVTVMNTDTTTHTVAADNKSFDTGEIHAGASATFVAPMAAGTYKFHCNIHNYMMGTLTVTG